jgi:dipeptidyl aminopeptidase/acylaminoacyl peptidase
MLSDSAFKFFLRSYSASPPESIQVSSSNPQDTNFLLISFWESLSPNKNFFTHQEEYDNTYTSIFDISSNETIYISDPNDGYFDLYSEFSPDSKFIAISQSNEDPGIHTTFQTLPTIRLRVYDIQSQELVASYKNVTFPKWSPDGTKFLFQEWEKHEIIGWYSYWDSPPCVYNTLDGLTNCYNQTLVDEVNQFSSLDWSPNQSMISYVFHDKGLCTIILSTSKIECILDYANIEENYIRGYSWSPNSNFISFEFDSVGPYSDDNDHPKLGIANIKTGEYFFVSDNINMHQLGIWRSIPNQ